jgi:hypothetical protein
VTAMRVTYTNYFLSVEPTVTKLFCTDNANDAWRP